MIQYIFTFGLFVALASGVMAQTFKSVKIDRHKNVVATTVKGHRVPLTTKGCYEGAQLSPDGRTVAWMEIATVEPPVNISEFDGRMIWYRGGKVHSFTGGFPVIWEFWFIDGGRKIGVKVGSLHGSTHNFLLDAMNGRRPEEFYDGDLGEKPAPAWFK